MQHSAIEFYKTKLAPLDLDFLNVSTRNQILFDTAYMFVIHEQHKPHKELYVVSVVSLMGMTRFIWVRWIKSLAEPKFYKCLTTGLFETDLCQFG